MPKKKRTKSKRRSSGKSPRPKRSSSSATPAVQELSRHTLDAILQRASLSLSKEDISQLTAAIDTLSFLTAKLSDSATTIAQLRKLLFGPSSEKTADVLGQQKPTDPDEEKPGEGEDEETDPDEEKAASGKGDADQESGTGDSSEEPAEAEKKPGHGRNGAEEYTGAARVTVSHDLQHGCDCPSCARGKVYRQKRPAVLVRIEGMAPLAATVYELERLRCNLCGKVFTASSPPGVGDDKYDETATAMIALLKYGCGLPFNRLKNLEKNLGIPLPASTQWEVVAKAAANLENTWEALVDAASQGDVLYFDDTRAKILEVAKKIRAESAAGEGDRTGIFTSGIISTKEDRRIALFITGRKHCGENLRDLLGRRSAELKAPIQMSDASSCNSAGDFETLVGNCLIHGRRKFVDVVGSFPEEVELVLKIIGEVYRHDAETRKAGLTPKQRLEYHQTHSAAPMKGLEEWLEEQFKRRLVEENSSLGKAIKYMQNHWEKLTLFLRVEGAPLDNNLCERSLKKPILHRKNSLFFKTQRGARVSDIYMSLIFTCELAGENPFDYLVALQRNQVAVAERPEAWLPWNYAEALELA